MTLYFDIGKNAKKYAPEFVEPPKMTWNDLMEMAEKNEPCCCKPSPGWDELNEFLKPLFERRR